MKSLNLKRLNRYPEYLKILKGLEANGDEIFSSKTVAKILDCSEEQVRKDIQAISTSLGKPGVGRPIKDVIADINNFLGVDKTDNVIIVGTGRLGQAFMSFGGFAQHGLNIMAGFDINPNLVNKVINDKTIYPLNQLEGFVNNNNVKIAILSTSKDVAQEVTNKLVNSGIKGIFNFTSVLLNVPDDVIVENVDLAASLLVLAHRLENK